MTDDLLTTMHAYAHGSSWAVWGSANPLEPFTRMSNIAFPHPDEARAVIHGRVLLVALNPGIGAPGKGREAWDNFHAGSKHNDHLLAEACRGTRLWGGYMTDVHPEITEGNATRVSSNADLVRAAVASLAHQIELLAEPDPVIVTLGYSKDPGPDNTSTHRRLLDNIDLLEQVGVRPERVVGVYHYSPRATSHYRDQPGESTEQRYRTHVHSRLRAAGLGALVEGGGVDGVGSGVGGSTAGGAELDA